MKNLLIFFYQNLPHCFWHVTMLQLAFNLKDVYGSDLQQPFPWSAKGSKEWNPYILGPLNSRAQVAILKSRSWQAFTQSSNYWALDQSTRVWSVQEKCKPHMLNKEAVQGGNDSKLDKSKTACKPIGLGLTKIELEHPTIPKGKLTSMRLLTKSFP